ncbi:hypothetical protein Clacol_007074 [Clathrus columnatus]|uniref:Ubiquitin-like domain-containing protein n=1 Tax=Clathrus columnatus TaxID=1419009 RepID=A0AAV5AI67_9AGAM|nr:hypothetical protein Clacol_007074 [Clathrus columnatus]
MVRIMVDNYKDRESLAVYELPEGSSIIDLKAEIEATEGIPIAHQRLGTGKWDIEEPDYRDYQDDQNLDSLIPGDLSEIIIYLRRALIYCYFRLRETAEFSRTDSNPQKPMIMKISVDLDEPICTSSLVRTARYMATISPELFVLDLDGQPTISISDMKKPFSYYGIRNGDHPHFKGLPLKRNALISAKRSPTVQPGWLYGSPIPSTDVESLGQPYVPAFDRRIVGYFPENYVSPQAVEEEVEQPSETTAVLEIPSLPPFQFPPASGMTFRLPISDKGHSFLNLTVNYECVSSPADPTYVTISLLCATHDIRRVSAISIFISIPESEVLNVEVRENEAHRKEIHTDKEVAENQSKERHLDGVNIGTHGTTVGFQGGISGKYFLGSTEKRSKVSRRKVTAGIDKEDSIFWNLKAPSTKLDEDGLNGEEFITLVLKKKPVEFRLGIFCRNVTAGIDKKHRIFWDLKAPNTKLDEDGLNGEEFITLVLKKKPARFKYNCRVTHAKNGVEKTTERRTKSSYGDAQVKKVYNFGFEEETGGVQVQLSGYAC